MATPEEKSGVEQLYKNFGILADAGDKASEVSEGEKRHGEKRKNDREKERERERERERKRERES